MFLLLLLHHIRISFWQIILAAITGVEKYIAGRWSHYQQNGLQSCSNSVFKNWLLKHRRLPLPLSNLYTLLWTCVFEAFRDICYARYGLDCAEYYRASNSSGDAFLKVCKPDLHLPPEREQLELVENMMRGGVSPIYEQWLFQANSSHLPNYETSKPSTYALMLDGINFYGGVMQNIHLPLKDFELDAHITLKEVLKISSLAQHEYIVEVDIDYPPENHESHKDYPLVPSKLKI